jgi:Domain of unknown function (DUF4129)
VSGARRLMLSGIGLTALLALVAVASRAHKPGGGSGAAAAHPPRLLWEYLASMIVVLFPIVGILMVWALATSRREKLLSGERNWRRTLAMLFALIPFFAAAFFIVGHLHPRGRGQTISVATTPTGKASKSQRKPNLAPLGREAGGKFQWPAAVIFGSLILGGLVTVGVSIYWRRMHGEEWAEEAALMEAVDEVLADSLDDLRAERDPRRAVIRTYARMERTFAAYGTPRQESEVPQEYVGRVLDRLGVSVFSVRRLTDLYSRAKFSPHEIDAGMKDEAIDALAGLRSELAHKEGEEAA